MKLQEHRIYSHFSKPWTVVGLTKDELGLVVGGFASSFFIHPKWLGIVVFGLSVAGVVVLKKYKKQTQGFSFVSFLHWHFGIPPKGTPLWPHSSERWWLS